MLLDFPGISITGRIVRRVVVLQTIGDAFDECCAVSGARSRERLETASWTAAHRCRRSARSDTACHSLLCERVGPPIAGARRRYGPLIVGDDEHHRKGPGAGDVDRRVHIALGGRTVANTQTAAASSPAVLEGGSNNRLRAAPGCRQ